MKALDESIRIKHYIYVHLPALHRRRRRSDRDDPLVEYCF